MGKGCQRRIQIVSRDSPVSKIVKHAPCRFEHTGIVVHDKDVLPSSHAWTAQLTVVTSGHNVRRSWQEDSHHRSPTNLALNLCRPFGLAGKPVDLRQSKSRSLAGLLGGEEWIEGSGQNIRRHSGTSVFHCDRDILTWPEVGLQIFRDGVENVCLYRKKATLRHCVSRIDRKVE